MSQQVQPASPASRKRTIWIGIAVAGIAVVAAGSYVFDIPPTDQVPGTITPAQRYRSTDQIQTKDVKLADQSVAQALQSDAVQKLIKDPKFQEVAKDMKALAGLPAGIQAASPMTHLPAS